MLKLRMLIDADISAIESWPAYPAEFEELDYALRSKGWLAEFHDKPDTWIFIAEHEKESIGFSLLTKTDAATAEIRIALRADKIGQGLGKQITSMTLKEGFSVIGLSRITLIARKNNERAIRLYHSLGFSAFAENKIIVNGKMVEFLEMTISTPA